MIFYSLLSSESTDATTVDAHNDQNKTAYYIYGTPLKPSTIRPPLSKKSFHVGRVLLQSTDHSVYNGENRLKIGRKMAEIF